MYLIETEHHFIQSAETEPPHYKCLGFCKRVMWRSDMEMHHKHNVYSLICFSCKGALRAATSEDYRVIAFDASVTTNNGFTVAYVSRVKPEFVDMAKRQWCS